MRVIDIMDLQGVEGPQGIQGVQGIQGLAGPGAVPADEAVASYVGVAGTVSETRKSLQRNGLTGWYHVEGNGVVVDGGLTDSTVKLQEIFDAVPNGGTVYIPETGWDKWISINATIDITQMSIRVLSVPRDTYSSSIRSTVPGLTFFKVFAAGVTFENVGVYGDGTDDLGGGATQTGIEFYGDTNGNVDSKVTGCGFSRLLTDVKIRGRNTLIEDNLFSASVWPVHITGVDAIYHTGPNATDNRGHVIRHNRFHGCGFDSTGALVHVDDTTQLGDLEISGNFADQGRGRGFVITGTSTKSHSKVDIFGNRGSLVVSDMYQLTYVTQFTIRSENLYGWATAGLGANGIVLNNCQIGEISDVAGFQLGKSGVVARNNTRINFNNVRFRQLGTLGPDVGHGFDIDSTNTLMDFDHIVADEYNGWGFTGSPTTSTLGRYSFAPSGGALGQFNSTTILPSTMFVRATDMIAGNAGTPVLSSTAGGVQSVGWLLDAATAETVSFQTPRTPSDWKTFSITALWAPTTAGAGNVVFQSFSTPLEVGAAAGGSQVSYGNVTAAAPAVLNQAVETALASFLTASTIPRQMRVTRAGADAADTYGADVALLGVVLTRLT